MDTDSIFVSTKISNKIVYYFKNLSPYSNNITLLKKDKEKVYFYGICSKRYCLYKLIKNKIEIVDYKLHGLGHLINPWENKIKNWQKEIWENILNLHYKKISKAEIYEKYSLVYAISRFTVSTPFLIKRFNVINKDKEYFNQIKPFNFFYLGFSTNKNNSVKPLSSFGGNPQELVYKKFIDYNTAKTKKGVNYWKPLGNTILEYINHREYKFDEELGYLKRKHIDCDTINYIGKETNNIEQEIIKVTKPIEYKNDDQFKEDLKELSNKKLKEKYGFKTRSHIKYWRDKLLSFT